jgi:hypothetical protein
MVDDLHELGPDLKSLISGTLAPANDALGLKDLVVLPPDPNYELLAGNH